MCLRVKLLTTLLMITWHSSPSQAIYKGNMFKNRQVFDLVTIKVKDDSTESYFICSGSHITSGWVLTSASCLSKGRVFGLRIKNSVNTRKTRVYMHPAFSRVPDQEWRSLSDVALIEITRNFIPVSSYNLTLPLPFEVEEAVKVGLKFFLLAGGQTQMLGPYEREKQMDWRWAQIRISELFCETENLEPVNELCSVTYPIRESNHKYLTCDGDAGGTAVFERPKKTTIVAIFSSSKHKCEFDDESLQSSVLSTYMKLSSYMPWILHQIDAVNDKHDDTFNEIIEAWSLHPSKEWPPEGGEDDDEYDDTPSIW